MPWTLLPAGPRLWAALGAVALVAMLVGGYFVWRGQQREIGRQEIIAADAKAVAEQAVKDKNLSADLVQKLRTELDNREATVAPVRERIVRVATECSKATGADAAAAAEWVRGNLARQIDRPPAR